jgi:putative transposase
MPQSLAKIYIHLIFSTKNREPILADDVRAELHAYMGGTLKGLDCVPLEINSEPDHAHLLFLLSRKFALSDVIGGLKKSATDWLRTKGERYRQFFWQAGYGAFSVSQSGLDDVRTYIQTQRQHHTTKTFQDEFRAFLKKYEIEYDERYVWD